MTLNHNQPSYLLSIVDFIWYFITEEILSTDHALWWSPDGQYILYAVFNDSNVRKFSFPYYGDMRNQYGEERKIAYPKAGDRNPTFKLKVFHVDKKTTVEVPPPDDFKNR